VLLTYNMGLFGDTTASNRAAFVQGLMMHVDSGCRAADVDIKMGNIKGPKSVTASGDCDLSMVAGALSMTEALTCNSKDAVQYTAKQLIKQKAKATGSGFQVGDIKSDNKQDLENKVSEFLRKRCAGLQSTVTIGDIDLSNEDITCKDAAHVDMKYATIGLDSHTNCLFDFATAIAQGQEGDQKAESKQDLSFLAMIAAILALVLFSPEILAMSGAGFVAQSPMFLVLMAIAIVWLLMEADCYLPWPLGHHFCTDEWYKIRHRTLFKQAALFCVAVLALSHASENKTWLVLAAAAISFYPPTLTEEEYVAAYEEKFKKQEDKKAEKKAQKKEQVQKKK